MFAQYFIERLEQSAIKQKFPLIQLALQLTSVRLCGYIHAFAYLIIVANCKHTMIKFSIADSVPFLNVSGLDEYGYFFTRDNLKFCFNITANENEVINEPKTATFTLTPRPLIYEEDLQRIDVDDLHFVILDNDCKSTTIL